MNKVIKIIVSLVIGLLPFASLWQEYPYMLGMTQVTMRVNKISILETNVLLDSGSNINCYKLIINFIDSTNKQIFSKSGNDIIICEELELIATIRDLRNKQITGYINKNKSSFVPIGLISNLHLFRLILISITLFLVVFVSLSVVNNNENYNNVNRFLNKKIKKF